MASHTSAIVGDLMRSSHQLSVRQGLPLVCSVCSVCSVWCLGRCGVCSVYGVWAGVVSVVCGVWAGVVSVVCVVSGQVWCL